MPFDSLILKFWHYLQINVVFIKLIKNIQIMVNEVTNI